MKQFLLAILLLTAVTRVLANKVELADAQVIAKNAFYQKVTNYMGPADFANLQIDEQYTLSRNGEACLYAFNFTGYGFIIIAAEDAIEPVIGYSFESQFSNLDHPENFLGLMEEYKDHIEYLRSNNIDASEEISQQWSSYMTFDPAGYFPEEGKDIEPLLTCTWNQDWPYNYYCPANSAGPGGHVYVGCVATAMSQIMFYWRYPEQGQGTHSYYIAPYGTLTVNYGETHYDWNGMLDNSDSKVNLPMALIGYHAAVSVNMQFGPNGSGAFSSNVPYAMQTYFKYSNQISYKERSFYQITVWNNMIQTELNNNRPVYYSGVNSSNLGHAFVVDGYHQADGMYHFNFGWSGQDNGWYAITNAGGFTAQQSMIHNIFPGDPSYPYGCEPTLELTNLVGSFEDGSGPQESYDQNANCSWLINPQSEADSVKYIKLRFVTLDTDPNDIISIYDGPTTADPLLGTYSGTIVPTGFITSTGNKMLLVFEANGDATTASGWKVEYDSYQPNFCIGVTNFTAPVGSFDDGSGSFYYKNYTNCMYQIQPQWAEGITMVFTEFSTEENVDVLKVYDAGNNQLLAELSGQQLPDPITVESGKIFMAFQADGAMNYPGFTVEYSVGNVGVNESNSAFGHLQVFPNPASNRLNVSFEQKETTSFEVRLVSVTGRVVYSEKQENFSGNYLNTVDLSLLSKGVYFLQLSSNLAVHTEKVIIR